MINMRISVYNTINNVKDSKHHLYFDERGAREKFLFLEPNKILNMQVRYIKIVDASTSKFRNVII